VDVSNKCGMLAILKTACIRKGANGKEVNRRVSTPVGTSLFELS
jgi:hypothetical protein